MPLEFNNMQEIINHLEEKRDFILKTKGEFRSNESSYKEVREGINECRDELLDLTLVLKEVAKLTKEHFEKLCAETTGEEKKHKELQNELKKHLETAENMFKRMDELKSQKKKVLYGAVDPIKKEDLDNIIKEAYAKAKEEEEGKTDEDWHKKTTGFINYSLTPYLKAVENMQTSFSYNSVKIQELIKELNKINTKAKEMNKELNGGIKKCKETDNWDFFVISVKKTLRIGLVALAIYIGFVESYFAGILYLISGAIFLNIIFCCSGL